MCLEVQFRIEMNSCIISDSIRGFKKYSLLTSLEAEMHKLIYLVGETQFVLP